MSSDSSTPFAFYYLSNFERALGWLFERYDGVLDATERAFISAFGELPRASRALLVRMLMRKGPYFRASKLAYDEIGCPLAASAALVELGWVEPSPALTLDTLFALSTKHELLGGFPDLSPLPAGAGRKADWLTMLRAAHEGERTWSEWLPSVDDRVLRVTVDALCNRLRLMFFGNLHQDWSEFVLADLGLLQYETVAFEPSSRAFQRRDDVDTYLELHACRERLDTWPGDAPLAPLVAQAAAIDCGNAWLTMRREKLTFAIGQTCERRADWDGALAAYEASAWPGSRCRRVRVLERCAHFDAALALAVDALRAPESDAERQQIERMLPRLRRQAGLPAARAASRAQPIPRDCIELARPHEPYPVEYAARDHLSRADAPAYYVENALINSLFGLLCWEPVFAAIPGAFFHPFQRGPADLYAPDFRARRAAQFDACLAQLDGTQYRDTICRHFAQKQGVQSPFVFWGALDGTLLEHALACLPAAHLRLWFERLLDDVRGNRSGLPDLVRFWPGEQRYELIEVKGPGDRLQDNQIRWLDYCLRHRMPVRVLDVRWSGNARRSDEVRA